jgi:FkbM family methyltransferase
MPFLRKGNMGDYQVAGELLDGLYSRPHFVPEVIYDCGAHIGAFTLHAACCFPSAMIVCFEPDKNNLALLRKNLAVNGVIAVIREVGVWDQTCRLYYHSGTGSVDGCTNEQPSSFPVQVESLEIKDADVWIKLDVEGAEYRVLPVIMRSRPLPRYISIELHGFNSKAGQELFDLIKASGYRCQGHCYPDNFWAVFNAELP